MKFMVKCGVVLVLLVAASTWSFGAGETETSDSGTIQGANMALAAVDGEPFVDHIHATPADYEAATGKSIATFYEAPMLSALVASGDLPPVVDRIGQDPQVVRPGWQIGQYGGVLRDVGGEGDAGQIIEEGQQPMAKWNPAASIFYSNIAKYWEVSDDGHVFTLHLRRGMKWSDGEVLDADDFVFFYDAILSDPDVSAVSSEPRGRYRKGGDLMKIKVLDSHTVQYTFAAPYQNAAERGWARGRSFAPEHYLKNYHIQYNSDAPSLAKEEGYDSWVDAFHSHHSDRGHTGSRPTAHRWPDLPTTDMWVLKEINPGVRFWGRNPFYWKIDTAGNQLPYADGVQVTIVEDPAGVVAAMAMQGDLDWPKNEFMDISDMPAYRRNEVSGNYQVHLYPSLAGATAHALTLNYSIEDPVQRELFWDIRFRQALSLSIDRQEISDKLYFGESIPWNAPVSSAWTGYEDWMGTYYADYDADRANALLDEIGLKWDADKRYRLLSDGRTLTLDGDAGDKKQTAQDFMFLMSGYLADIGIKMEPKLTQHSLIQERGYSNLQNVNWGGVGGSESVGRSEYAPNLIPPFHWIHCCPKSSILWAQWYHNGPTEGEEPPELIKRMFEVHDIWQETQPGTPEYHDAINELITLNVENLFQIGTVSSPPTPMVEHNRMGNLPGETGFLMFSQVEPYNLDTIFIKQ